MAREKEDVNISKSGVSDADSLELNQDPYSSGEEKGHQRQESRNNIPEDEDEVSSQILQIEALAAMDPSIKEMPEYKNLLASAEKVKKSPAKDDARRSVKEEDEDDQEDEEDETDLDEDVDYDDEEDEDDQEDEEEEEDDTIKGNDPFGIKKKSKKDDDAVEIEVPDELADFIEQKYSMKNVEKFFDTVDNWRNKAQEAAKFKQDYEAIINDLNAVPADLKAALKLYTDGKDYRAAFVNPVYRVDYDKPFEKQDKEAIVHNYFSDEVEKLNKKKDKGDIDDVDYEEKIDLLYSSAKRLFDGDKKQFNEQRAKLIENEEKKQESLKKSAVSSVEALKKVYPNFSKADLQKIQQRLVNGSPHKIFFNADGTYRADAAERLAYAEFGKRVIQELLVQAEKKGESKANQKIVERGNKQPRETKAQQHKRKEAVNAIQHLSSSFQADPYSVVYKPKD